MGIVAHNYALSQPLGDETAHMVGGHLLLKERILYKDLQFNHQPFNYFFSAIVEIMTTPDNLYQYISRQRDAVYVYSAIWNMLLYLTVGIPALPFIILFEISKYWLSGYKLLAETLAVYPMLYILGVLMKRHLHAENISNNQLQLVSVAAFIIFASLLPLWPAVVYLFVVLVYLNRKYKKKWLYILGPFFILTISLFTLVPINEYLRETIYYNYAYFMPFSIPTVSHANIFLLLFRSVLPPYQPSQLLVALTLIFLIITVASFRKKRFIYQFGVVVILLIFSNLRVDNYDFGSFHLLIWYGIILFIGLYFAVGFFIRFNTLHKAIAVLYVVFCFGWVIQHPLNPIYTKPNTLEEFGNNYAQSETYGKAIKILKSENDRLLIWPSDPLMLWVGDIYPATRVIEHFAWVHTIPEYQTELKQLFLTSPPEFIVDMESTDNILFRDALSEKYVRLNHVGKPSKLYILRSKFDLLSSKQIENLQQMLFTIK